MWAGRTPGSDCYYLDGVDRSISLRRACRIASIGINQPSIWAKAHLMEAQPEGSRCSLEKLLRLTVLAGLRVPLRSSTSKMKRAVDALIPPPNLERVTDCDVVWDVDAQEAQWASSPGHLRVLLTEGGHPGPYLVIPMGSSLRRAVAAFNEGDDDVEEDDEPPVE